MHTPCPNSVSICSCVLPPVEISLHVVVKVARSSLDHSAVIRVVVPLARIVEKSGFGSSNNDTTIWPGDQVVIIPGVKTHGVGTLQGSFQWIRNHDPATDSSDGDNLPLVIRRDRRCICVACENNPFGLDGASVSYDRPTPIGIAGVRHSDHRSIRLKVYPG